VAGVGTAIEAAGASLRYLPPYSPDLNPHRTALRKLKALLKKLHTAPWMPSGMKSGFCSMLSLQRSAPTTSEQQDILYD
jgi:transposase